MECIRYILISFLYLSLAAYIGCSPMKLNTRLKRSEESSLNCLYKGYVNLKLLSCSSDNYLCVTRDNHTLTVGADNNSTNITCNVTWILHRYDIDSTNYVAFEHPHTNTYLKVTNKSLQMVVIRNHSEMLDCRNLALFKYSESREQYQYSYEPMDHPDHYITVNNSKVSLERDSGNRTFKRICINSNTTC